MSKCSRDHHQHFIRNEIVQINNNEHIFATQLTVQSRHVVFSVGVEKRLLPTRAQLPTGITDNNKHGGMLKFSRVSPPVGANYRLE